MAAPAPDPVYVLRGTNSDINALSFHCSDPEPELPILYSGSSSGLIHIWNLKTHRACSSLDGHSGKSVYWVKSLSNRRNALLSQGRDQNICLWDLAEGRNIVTDSLFTENVGFCKCSHTEVTEKRCLLATPWKGLEEVQVLELPSKTSICTLKPETSARMGMPMCLRMWWPNVGSHPLLLTGYEDGSVVLWNLSMGRMLSRLTCHQEPIMSLDFDSEKTKGVSGSSEKMLCVWSHTELQNLEVGQLRRGLTERLLQFQGRSPALWFIGVIRFLMDQACFPPNGALQQSRNKTTGNHAASNTARSISHHQSHGQKPSLSWN
ncbi:guanine nucleotide-binding protein subunit beta-like protein 1 isoform 2-T7 [Liasis olivaceus]